LKVPQISGGKSEIFSEPTCHLRSLSCTKARRDILFSFHRVVAAQTASLLAEGELRRRNCKENIMNKLILMSLLGALSLGTAAVAAPSSSDTVTITGPESKIELPQHQGNMWSEDYYDYLGSYALSNGQTLTLSSRNAKVYAAVGDAARHELVAQASNTFVARDAKLKMTIDLHPDRDASGTLYMVVPADKVALGAAERVVKVSF
jgi:hypothetical protein